ncbi:hypothetical protein SAMN05421755_100270 [Nitrosomonas sp. Nm33]|nr:hypothetical protein SAMN05421755_100270 [Nitrosomonas sp. Nm33]
MVLEVLKRHVISNRETNKGEIEMNTLYPAIPPGFAVQFVDIEEAFTEGETIKECLFNGTEVLSGILEVYLDEVVKFHTPASAPTTAARAL